MTKFLVVLGLAALLAGGRRSSSLRFDRMLRHLRKGARR